LPDALFVSRETSELVSRETSGPGCAPGSGIRPGAFCGSRSGLRGHRGSCSSGPHLKSASGCEADSDSVGRQDLRRADVKVAGKRAAQSGQRGGRPGERTRRANQAAREPAEGDARSRLTDVCAARMSGAPEFEQAGGPERRSGPRGQLPWSGAWRRSAEVVVRACGPGTRREPPARP